MNGSTGAQQNMEQVEETLASGPPFSCILPGRWIPKINLKESSDCSPGLEPLLDSEYIQLMHSFVNNSRNSIYGYWVVNRKGQRIYCAKEVKNLNEREALRNDRAFKISFYNQENVEIFNVQRETTGGDIVSIYLASTGGLLSRIRFLPHQEGENNLIYAIEDENGTEILHGSLPYLQNHDKQIITFNVSLTKTAKISEDYVEGYLKELEWSFEARKKYSQLSRHFGIKYPKLGNHDLGVKIKIGIIALLILIDISYAGNLGRPKIGIPWYRKLLCFSQPVPIDEATI